MSKTIRKNYVVWQVWLNSRRMDSWSITHSETETGITTWPSSLTHFIFLPVCLSHFSSLKVYILQLAGSRRTSHAGCCGFKPKAGDRAYWTRNLLLSSVPLCKFRDIAQNYTTTVPLYILSNSSLSNHSLIRHCTARDTESRHIQHT